MPSALPFNFHPISHWSFAYLLWFYNSHPYFSLIVLVPISHGSFSPLFCLCFILLIPISYWSLSSRFLSALSFSSLLSPLFPTDHSPPYSLSALQLEQFSRYPNRPQCEQEIFLAPDYFKSLIRPLQKLATSELGSVICSFSIDVSPLRLNPTMGTLHVQYRYDRFVWLAYLIYFIIHFKFAYLIRDLYTIAKDYW
jgi:hypothetical protein